MRLYPAERQEDLRTRKLLKGWHEDGLLTADQHQQLQDEIVSDWRTTNLFLRIVLFLFAVAIVALLEGLLFVMFDGQITQTASLVLLLLSSAACYAGAEYAVREFHLFHFGIEEALAVCSIAFLCLGLQLQYRYGAPGPDAGEFLIMAVCAGASLWTWYRFGYWYAFVAAMMFVAVGAGCLTVSLAAVHGLVVLMYAVGLAGVMAAWRRQHDDPLHLVYASAEAWLWAGIYLSLNLVLNGFVMQWSRGFGLHGQEPLTVFYWFTWVLIWCLPPVLLAHAVRRRERLLLSLGATLLVVTLACNKSYLHWQRHPWDPMLLGVILVGTAWSLRRWLASGTGGIRNGFTAARISGNDFAWMSTGTAAFNFLTPHVVIRNPHHGAPDTPHGEGGASGGGGAGGTF